VRRIGGLAAALACIAALTACPNRELPTSPVVSSSQRAEDAAGPRMPVVPASRHRGGTLTRMTPGVTAPATTPTRTPTRTPTSSSFSTPTSVPTVGLPTATPTRTPTRTPTQGAATLIRLRAVRWAWQWIAGPGATPGNPSSSITLKSGQTYQFHVYNGDIQDDAYQPHYFSGILGMIPGSQLPYGAADFVWTFTAPSVSSPTNYGFSCMEFGCGPVARHEGMLGTIIVVP